MVKINIISNNKKLILGAVAITLMVFAFFCPPFPYEQISLAIGIVCVIILVSLSLQHIASEYTAPSWRLDPDALPDGVIVTDMNGNVQYVNEMARKIIPGSHDAKHITTLFHEWHQELADTQKSEDLVQAVLSAPELQFSEMLYLENGKGYERTTRPMPQQAIRVWLLRDITHMQSVNHDSEMHSSMVEADAARTVELAEQLYLAKAELEAKQAELTRLANTDSLTGLLNRRRFTALGESVVQSALEDNIWVIMMDIDHFKRINDTYGHAAGDVAIRDFANIAVTQVDKAGFVGRMGGEEFAAVLENCDRDKAITVAENIRKATAKHQTISETEKFRFTCSIGVAQWRKGEITIAAVLDRSDKALNSAKTYGRNRVVGYEVSET